jgi:glycosyltransferase involved in cell wall biosynthesis
MANTQDGLRIALLAGTLGQGGTEKQTVYMARALQQAGVAVRVYSLTQGDFHESALKELGIEPIWVGKYDNPLLRMVSLARAIGQFKPHILQATHLYTNLYVAIIARLYAILGIGSIRNDILYEADRGKRWYGLLLGMVPALLVNSYTAARNTEGLGIREEAISVLPNVIDLESFDEQARRAKGQVDRSKDPVVVHVANMVPEKHLDRFLIALARAREEVSELRGVLVGDGPLRPAMEALANDLGLRPDGVQFMGRRDDVPAILGQADMFLMTSENEGFPNVLLEAMAARLPVITTPAGDAGTIVRDTVTGYVVPFDDVEKMAELMVRLAHSPNLRSQLGDAGRTRVEQSYSYEGLAGRLLTIYHSVAQQQNHRRLLRILSSKAGMPGPEKS